MKAIIDYDKLRIAVETNNWIFIFQEPSFMLKGNIVIYHILTARTII